MGIWRTTLAVLSILVLSAAPAASQAKAPKPDKPAPDDPGGDEVELGDDDDDGGLSDDKDGVPGGAAENPDAPKLGDDDDADDRAASPAAGGITKANYPIEVAKRPQLLPSGMSEVFFEAPVLFDPFVASGYLRADYGVTSQIQVGLRYGVGALDDNGDFETGKAVAIDGLYGVFDWLAVQMSIPILLDPFALGVTLGAPMKFQFDKFSLFFGRDLLSIKISKFVPDVNNALATAGLVAAEESGTTLPDGDLRFLGGIIYQLEPHIALTAESGYIATDFSSRDAGVPIHVQITYSKGNRIDLGARAGFFNLDNAKNNAFLSFLAAIRI